MFVLQLKSENTIKYILSPWEIPQAFRLGFPSGSGYISSYIPSLVTLQIQSLPSKGYIFPSQVFSILKHMLPFFP